MLMSVNGLNVAQWAALKFNSIIFKYTIVNR